jgi:hypothetical protein
MPSVNVTDVNDDSLKITSDINRLTIFSKEFFYIYLIRKILVNPSVI